MGLKMKVELSTEVDILEKKMKKMEKKIAITFDKSC